MTRRSSLQPDFAAAYLNLGGLQEELGDMAAAEAVVPDRAREAADLRAAARPAGDPLAIQAARSRPGRPRRTLERRQARREPARPAAFCPGPCTRRQGRITLGRPNACARANALTIETNRKRSDYDPVDHERFVDGLLRAFDRDLFARLAGAGSSSHAARVRLRLAALGHHA